MRKLIIVGMLAAATSAAQQFPQDQLPRLFTEQQREQQANLARDLAVQLEIIKRALAEAEKKAEICSKPDRVEQGKQ